MFAVTVLLFAAVIAPQEVPAAASPEIGTPILTVSVSHQLGTTPKAKTKIGLPLDLEGELQIDGFDARKQTLMFRLKLSKKQRGEAPAGYNFCTYGEPHTLTAHDSCVFWLKDSKAFLTVYWDFNAPEDQRIVLTVDHWHIAPQ